MTTSTAPSATAADANPFEGEPAGVLFGLPMPMARAMALRGEAVGHDRARIRMLYQPEQTNSRGDVHGGAIASLLDCGLAAAVRSHDPAAFGVVTIDLTLHFVSAGGGDLIATAHCERRGRSISFARGEVHTEDGTLVAMATGTFKLVARAASTPPSP
ncbi:PaaI family thioesterase [Xenophilus azovorans]|uniref:PaaI family thioesterase n=1 Tax=Xenophilus azovorans TaxID=151755 RepID=UPI00056EF4D7|nr:PaaI family thioesterase [Xenophilus azovorans]